MRVEVRELRRQEGCCCVSVLEPQLPRMVGGEIHERAPGLVAKHPCNQLILTLSDPVS